MFFEDVLIFSWSGFVYMKFNEVEILVVKFWELVDIDFEVLNFVVKVLN